MFFTFNNSRSSFKISRTVDTKSGGLDPKVSWKSKKKYFIITENYIPYEIGKKHEWDFEKKLSFIPLIVSVSQIIAFDSSSR